MGFVNEVVADDDVEKRALQLALAIAGNSPDSVMALLYGESQLSSLWSQIAAARS